MNSSVQALQGYCSLPKRTLGMEFESVCKRRCAAGLLDGTPFAKRPRWVSQITGPSPQRAVSQTPVSQAGFRWRVAGKGQQLTLLSIEVHADSRFARPSSLAVQSDAISSCGQR